MPGASIFFDVAPGSGVLSRSSFRAGAFAYTGGSSTDDRDYHLWLAGGRLEACPTWLGGAAVRIHPCVSVDLGTLQTSGSGPSARTAGAFWAAAGFGLRLDVPASERFGFEAEVAAQFPFTRYDIVAGVPEKPLYRTAAVGVGAGLGAYFVLP
jgi:hypothetical protein